MSLFDHPGPRWFTIPAHRPFVDDVAAGLMAALAGGGPEALSQAIVLTPTRRGARALADAFVGAGGGRAVLLPQIRALGDLDEGEPPFEPGDLALDLPPAIGPLRRRFELARLVSEHERLFDRPLDAPAVLELADALAGFLDSLQIEEIDDLDRVQTLVEGDLALHWRKSAEFLALATVRWPQRLAELGLVDVTERRTALLRRLAESWDARPPAHPLIAAGSTGTAPATADLLKVIANARQGAVVLPGLDQELADSAWEEVGEAHPQGAMRRLLARAGSSRAEVRAWPAPDPAPVRGRARRRVINEALRPAEATADWVRVIGEIRREGEAAGVDPIAEGLQGLSLVAARTEEEAAAIAALLLREALETPDKTAALVTPDPALARRVSARLARWGCAADSSAGAPLTQSPVGALVVLMAGLLADPLDPVRLLAVVKHPLAGFGLDSEAREAAARRLERYGLRGARPRDWAEVQARLDAAAARARDLHGAPDLADRVAAAVDTALAPFAAAASVSPADAARALAAGLEAVAAQADGGVGALWSGAAGESAASLLAGLIEDGAALPHATAGGFAALVERLVATQVVRTGGASHPRLRILGAIEARLIRADRLVLAGLEEGVWPRTPPADPFLSRPMRGRLGLPPPERRIGLAAHDFAQAACAPEVVLIHVERRGGQPAVKSRWLWRLETLARGAGVALPRRDEALAWARALDAAEADPPEPLRPARPPEPRPPVESRPCELPVTEVEKLVRDPYAVYARRILSLRALSPPDERVEVRIRGTAIHAAFEALAPAWPVADPAAWFAERYIEELRKAGATEGSLARERTLAERAGHWVAAFERQRREAGADVRVEQTGRLALHGLDFVLTAKADRLEVAGGAVHVLDFKTGRAPTVREIETGFSPQLTLTAAIVAAGGFDGIGAHEPGELVYARVTGREPAGELFVRAAPGESRDYADQALEGLGVLVRRYDRPGTPYRSHIAPRFVKAYASDYDHLARVREWSAGDEEEGE